MEKDKLKQLKAVKLFSSLSDDELEDISSILSFRSFKKGSVILNEEDTTEFMYVVAEGKVKAFKTNEEGKETILAIHGAGEFFGEMSLLDGKTVPATVSTIEESLVALISRKNFYSLISTQDSVLVRLLQILCSRIRDSWEQIRMLNFRNAADRVRLLFMKLAEEHGKKSAEGLTIELKLTHQDIADMTGLTRETVTRVLDKWQKGKLITVLKSRFIMLSPRFLHDEFGM